MSARARLEGVCGSTPPPELIRDIDGYRVEVLGEVIDRLARRATLYGSSQTVNEVMRDLARLADEAETGGAS